MNTNCICSCTKTTKMWISQGCMRQEIWLWISSWALSFERHGYLDLRLLLFMQNFSWVGGGRGCWGLSHLLWSWPKEHQLREEIFQWYSEGNWRRKHPLTIIFTTLAALTFACSTWLWTKGLFWGKGTLYPPLVIKKNGPKRWFPVYSPVTNSNFCSKFKARGFISTASLFFLACALCILEYLILNIHYSEGKKNVSRSFI